MARSRVALSPDVTTPVVVLDTVYQAAGVADAIYRAPGILVIDGHRWTEPLTRLQPYLERRRRAFDEPFATGECPAEVIRPFLVDLESLFRRIFPDREPVEVRKSWRPMISGPEPLHFDTFDETGVSSITAYLNVSPEPRRYGVSHDLSTILRTSQDFIASLPGQIRPVEHLAVRLRAMALKTKTGPLGAATPRHDAAFAPGAVWFFNPKLVSHELRHGTGAICYSWRVPQFVPSAADVFDQTIGAAR